MRVRFKWACQAPLEKVTFGFLIRNRFGQDVFGTNGKHLRKLVNVRGDGQGEFYIEALNLMWGLYTINLAAHSGNTHLDNCYHWWDNAATFEVVQDEKYYFEGFTRLNARLETE